MTQAESLMEAWKTIQKLREALDDQERQWLQANGWEFVEGPHSYWLWKRTIGGREVLVDQEMALEIQQADLTCEILREDREGK
jgi:hypothetical protein